MAKGAPTTDNTALISDAVRHVFGLTLILASVVVFYMFDDSSLLFRVLGIVAAVIVASGVFFTTEIGRETGGFLKTARIELGKVVWPTRKETTQTTLVVFVLVLIVALLLWAIDLGLAAFMRAVIY